MLDPATGVIAFRDGESIASIVSGGCYESGGLFFLVQMIFDGGALRRVSLTQVDADYDARTPKSWADWSMATEIADQRTNEAWLAKSLGPPHESFAWGPYPDGQRYRFPWGLVESCYSPQTGAASIAVQYARET